MSKRSVPFILLSCLIAATLSAATDPFIGAWTLNASKSKAIDMMQVKVVGANRYAITTFGPGATVADHLDLMRFVRVHRTAIVNIDSIVELLPISHGEFQVRLRDGHCSRISRTYRALLEKRLGQSL